MTFYKGNKTAAAQSLGIAIRTLDARLDKYKKEKEQHVTRNVEAQAKRDQLRARQRAIPGGAQFDTGATPSVHSAEVTRRRAEQAPARIANGSDSNVSPEGVQPKSSARAAAK